MPGRKLHPATARRLVIPLAAVVVLPSALLIWFGYRLLAQDQDLVAQRDLERRQAAARSILASLQHQLDETELRMKARDLPAEITRLVLTTQSASVTPAGRAAWLPIAAPLREAPDEPFAKAEAVEARNPSAAFGEYEALARAPDKATRAAALLRLARTARRLDRLDRALEAYRAMSRIEGVAVLGAPADLQGRRWAIEVLQQLGRKADVTKEADALGRDLVAQKWSLDGGNWGLVAAAVFEVTGRKVEVPDSQRMVSELADALTRDQPAPGAPSQRRLIESGRVRALALVTATDKGVVAAIADERVVSEWMRAALDGAPRTGASLRLLSSTGSLWAGAPASGGVPVLIAQAESGLPWTVAIDSGDTGDLQAEFSDRRRLFASGVALVIAMLVAATWLIWRLVRRQMEVARLQTDFVAAVSHEFRTPLTSLRHISDLLDESDDVDPGRRKQFYGTLGRNTDRLHRLVESLLDFARMEGGRRQFNLRPSDVSGLAAEVVEEFRHDVGADRASITFRNGGVATARVDAASFSTALRNLLDNAVKYSEGRAEIDVAVTGRPDGHITVAVADKGPGIPPQERKSVFNKFVRGADANTRGIKGTGLGLALVSHIVDAHGGRVELESAVGEGSTFTIVLPGVLEAGRPGL